MSIATLSIDLEARLSKLQEGMDKATRLSDKAAQQIEAKWSALGELGRGFGAALVGAFSVGTIAAFTRATVNALDALNDASDATGATVENLSALEDVARRNGGTLDDVTGILVKFNGLLKEADGTNGTSQALAAIGLSAADLKKLDPAEALRQVAVALGTFADDGEKARIVQDLFGKSVREAAPFLKDLAEQTELLGSVTTETAKSAETLNKQLFSMQTDLQNAGRAITAELLPQMALLSEYAKSSSGEVTLLDLALGGIKNTFETVAVLGANTAFVLKTLGREAGGFVAKLEARASGDKTGLQAITEGLADDAKRARAELDEFERRIFGGSARNENYGNEGRGAVRPNIKSAGGGGGGGGGRGGGKLKMGEPYGPEISDEELAARRFMGPLIDVNELSERNERLRELNNLLASTPTSQMERLVQIESDLNEAFINGQVGSQAYAEALEKLGDFADLLDPKLKKLGDTLEDFATRGRMRIEAQLGDSLYQALSGNFDNIGKAWGDLIKRIFAERLSKDFIDFLIGSSSGSSADTLTKVFTFFGGGRATGGPTQAGKMYEVNETGVPELFDYGGRQFLLSGKQPGYVHPLAAGGAGGRGGVTSSLNVSVGEGVSLSQVHAVVTGALKQQEGRLLRLSREGRL